MNQKMLKELKSINEFLISQPDVCYMSQKTEISIDEYVNADELNILESLANKALNGEEVTQEEMEYGESLLQEINFRIEEAQCKDGFEFSLVKKLNTKNFYAQSRAAYQNRFNKDELMEQIFKSKSSRFIFIYKNESLARIVYCDRDNKKDAINEVESVITELQSKPYSIPKL